LIVCCCPPPAPSRTPLALSNGAGIFHAVDGGAVVYDAALQQWVDLGTDLTVGARVSAALGSLAGSVVASDDDAVADARKLLAPGDATPSAEEIRAAQETFQRKAQALKQQQKLKQQQQSGQSQANNPQGGARRGSPVPVPSRPASGAGRVPIPIVKKPSSGLLGQKTSGLLGRRASSGVDAGAVPRALPKRPVLGKGNSGSNLVSGSTSGGSGAGARASPTAQLQQPSGGGGGGGGDGSYQKIRWVKGELLGKGAHGFVYQGLNKATGQLIAVKQVDLSALATDASLAAIAKEMELLKDLDHTNIVQYFGSEVDGGYLNIFLEFVSGGSLFSMLERFGPLSETIAKLYLKQILVAIEYLHDNGVVHRDIKAENILIDTAGVIKVADFGCSKLVLDGGSECKSFLGTPFFLAPEVVRETSYNEKSDVWSIGCTVIQLLSGKPPWSELSNAFAVVFKIGNTKDPPMFPPNISANATDFLRQSLAIDPRERPSVKELRNHPWFNENSGSGDEGP
jgi:hypothetical protein